MRVMMAGEGVSALQAMQRYLQLLGHQVTIVSETCLIQSGTTEEPPDLIVMEYNLAWLGSVAVLDYWLADPEFRSVPVVFFSRNRTMPEDACVPRIIAHVTWPFHPLMMAGVVRFLDNMEWVIGQLATGQQQEHVHLLCR